ncbi:MAG: metallopeptidase family protein [Frankiales bacterium]|nr:metallopeptidase family protein [Frankiales bacterium]
MRGILLPSSTPAWRTRAERFDDAILDAVETIERRAGKKVARIEFAVEEVPPEMVDPLSRTYDDESGVPLASAWAATRKEPARIVLYRRPIESRAPHPEDLEDFVRDLVVEQVADLLGIDPDELDPPPA